MIEKKQCKLLHNNIDYFAYKNNFVLHQEVKSREVFDNHYNNHKKPLVTIAIPTYKRPLLIQEAVNSILKQKGFADYEILIVDNDNTGEFQEDYLKFLNSITTARIRYYQNEQNITTGNWSRCIKLANGTWMTILCDDDILFKDYLYEMTQPILKHSNLNRVECRYMPFNQLREASFKNKVKYFFRHIVCGKNYDLRVGWYNKIKMLIINKVFGKYKKINLDMYLMGCFTAPHSQLYRVEYARALGGFNHDYAPISDYVFNSTYVYKYNNCIQINQYLCGYRIFANDSLKKSVILGCLKGNKLLTNYILHFNHTLKGRIGRYLYLNLSFNEVFGSIYKKVLFFILFKIACMFIDNPRR